MIFRWRRNRKKFRRNLEKQNEEAFIYDFRICEITEKIHEKGTMQDIELHGGQGNPFDSKIEGVWCDESGKSIANTEGYVRSPG